MTEAEKKNLARFRASLALLERIGRLPSKGT